MSIDSSEAVGNASTSFNEVASSERREMFDVLFGRFTTYFAVVAIPISFFLPPDGLGIKICWVQNLFDLPCPGCGLTRSITCISHLQFGKAIQYQPFGFFAYIVFLFNIVFLISSVAKQKTKDLIRRHHVAIRRSYLAFIVCFIVFGFSRLILAFLDQSSLY